MKNTILLTTLLMMLFINTAMNNALAQKIVNIKAKQITEWKSNNSDTVLVINFWATWCKPCLEEMPAFEEAGARFFGQKVRFLMVSNDFKKQVESKLKPYLIENRIRNEVFYLDETNPNQWIDLVDANWGGSIPATLIVQGSSGYLYFHEGKLGLDELIERIQPLLK